MSLVAFSACVYDILMDDKLMFEFGDTFLVCCFRARFKPFQDEVSVVIKEASIVVFLPLLYGSKFSLVFVFVSIIGLCFYNVYFS